MSISVDELVQRNSRFAAAGAFAGLPFPTNQTLRVVGCVDSRVDPSHVLGLALGEAASQTTPSSWPSGLVYDVNTGLIVVAVPATTE